MTIMKNVASYAEIALWDTAIALMSSERTRRIYSYTVAAVTLRLQPVHPNKIGSRFPLNLAIVHNYWIRLGTISIFSLLLGILIGILKSS